ncbi:MAG: phosphate regulon transcriptional regulator PhoB [Pseudomonadota bacterium]
MADATDPVVLVVEDEPAQMEVLRYNLKTEGYQVVSAMTGEDALMLTGEIGPDLVLLDWMLPNLSGIEVCRRLKRSKATADVPVLMLTARGEEEDRIRGLDIGADDYVVKPYSVKELMARVRAVLRRSRPSVSGDVLIYEDIQLDQQQHRVTRNGLPIDLGPTEYRLLLTLMEAPGRVWSRENLLDRVWGRTADVETRTVDVHIGRLRKVLKNGGGDPIRTVRGFGYSLDKS